MEVTWLTPSAMISVTSDNYRAKRTAVTGLDPFNRKVNGPRHEGIKHALALAGSQLSGRKYKPRAPRTRTNFALHCRSSRLEKLK